MFQRMLIGAGVLILSGCASLPDFNRVQNTMEQMAYYTGIMACNMPVMSGNTSRMADAIERMERKTDAIVVDLQQQGKRMEETVQNYGQSFLDNDKAMIRNLKGIQEELAELRKTVRAPIAPGSGASKDQEEVNARLQAKLSDLDAKISAIVTQIAKNSAARNLTK